MSRQTRGLSSSKRSHSDVAESDDDRGATEPPAKKQKRTERLKRITGELDSGFVVCSKKIDLRKGKGLRRTQIQEQRIRLEERRHEVERLETLLSSTREWNGQFEKLLLCFAGFFDEVFAVSRVLAPSSGRGAEQRQDLDVDMSAGAMVEKCVELMTGDYLAKLAKCSEAQSAQKRKSQELTVTGTVVPQLQAIAKELKAKTTAMLQSATFGVNGGAAADECLARIRAMHGRLERALSDEQLWLDSATVKQLLQLNWTLCAKYNTLLRNYLHLRPYRGGDAVSLLTATGLNSTTISPVLAIGSSALSPSLEDGQIEDSPTSVLASASGLRHAKSSPSSLSPATACDVSAVKGMRQRVTALESLLKKSELERKSFAREVKQKGARIEVVSHEQSLLSAVCQLREEYSKTQVHYTAAVYSQRESLFEAKCRALLCALQHYKHVIRRLVERHPFFDSTIASLSASGSHNLKALFAFADAAKSHGTAAVSGGVKDKGAKQKSKFEGSAKSDASSDLKLKSEVSSATAKFGIGSGNVLFPENGSVLRVDLFDMSLAAIERHLDWCAANAQLLLQCSTDAAKSSALFGGTVAGEKKQQSAFLATEYRRVLSEKIALTKAVETLRTATGKDEASAVAEDAWLQNDDDDNGSGKNAARFGRVIDALKKELSKSASKIMRVKSQCDLEREKWAKRMDALQKQNNKLVEANYECSASLKRLTEEKQVLSAQKAVIATQCGRLQAFASELKRCQQLALLKTGQTQAELAATREASKQLRFVCAESSQRCALWSAEHRQMTEERKEAVDAMKALRSECGDLRQELATAVSLCEEWRMKAASSMAVSTAASGVGSGKAVVASDAVIRHQLKLARNRLTCSVCTLNDKNRILTRCFHMFCSDCLQQTIASRNRSCPICKKKFSKSDIQIVCL